MLRPYDAAVDSAAARRIWREIGWLQDGDNLDSFDRLVASNRSWVGLVHGEAECLVQSAPGTLRYLDRDLPLCSICAVTTSPVGRQAGLASQLAARLVAEDAQAGAAVQCLGMFDQGFYDRLGFGTGALDYWVGFDPAMLRVESGFRPPTRLTADAAQAAHAARLGRRRTHGAVTLSDLAHTEHGMLVEKDRVGYAWFDGDQMTHFLWGRLKERFHGPLCLHAVVWREPWQLLEMLAFLHSLSDQVYAVEMVEPPGIQIQDLLRHPARTARARERGDFETGYEAYAWWQMRMNDVPACVAALHLPHSDLRFNAQLTDPIADYLPSDTPWRGAGGEFVVTLGEASRAAAGHDPALPTLTASVNAFTRLWLGVRPASGLATTGQLTAPPDLLKRLDAALCLPTPRPDWEL